MRRRLWILAGMMGLPAAGFCASAAATASLDSALSKLYNFDFPAAHAALNEYIGLHPTEPLPYAFRGAAYLFYELDRLGALESEFLTSDDELTAKQRRRPDPEIRTRFLHATAEAQQRAEAVLKDHPNDRDALFTMVVVSGTMTDYAGLVEKRRLGSLTPAKRANMYAQRLLRIDPKFYDAYLTAGFSEYMLGSIPFIFRWFIHFDGVNGDRQRGIQELQLVAREGRYFRPLAKVFLAIIDLREKRTSEAARLLQELTREYPGNPLYKKELAKIGNLRTKG